MNGDDKSRGWLTDQDSWLDVTAALAFVNGVPGGALMLRWKLRREPSEGDLTFRIEINNDRETK